jgi:ABC-type multidrug transport system ATPase subunit
VSADEPAIEAIALSKTYRGGVRALAELDLRVEHGEVFGFLGPNGRGQEHDDPPPPRPDPADG